MALLKEIDIFGVKKIDYTTQYISGYALLNLGHKVGICAILKRISKLNSVYVDVSTNCKKEKKKHEHT